MRCIVVLLMFVVWFWVDEVASAQNSEHPFSVTRDVVWASPGNQQLTMDIYVPSAGKARYPVLVIYHGGGWLVNTNAMMDSMAIYVASHAGYVVCNVNYRLLGDRDNTIRMDEVVEDAMGAAIWVKNNIHLYGGDNSLIAVTGDSAGGHLAAMVMMGSCAVTAKPVLDAFPLFCPTGMKDAEAYRDWLNEGGLQLGAVALSYPALNIHQNCMTGFETIMNPFWGMAKVKPRRIFADSISVLMDGELYRALSPALQIPDTSVCRLPPQFVMVGSRDIITPPLSVKGYVEDCRKAGQTVSFWENPHRPHAFLDAVSNPLLGNHFYKDAPEALNRMLRFLDGQFYPAGN